MRSSWAWTLATTMACGSPSDASALDAGKADATSADAASTDDAPALDSSNAEHDASIGDDAGPMATPRMTYLGGPMLTAPKIVTISFAGDDPTLVARLQQFGDSITSTLWWTAVASEYCTNPGGPCVGPGHGAGHVVLPAADTEYTDSIRGGDSTVRALVQAAVSSGAVPAPDEQTLYLLYFPAGTIVLLDGNASCAPSSFASYHDVVQARAPDAGGPTNVAYAVVPRCSSTEVATTVAASHEIVEAATDPSPENAPAFQLTDMVWTAFGPDVADACAAVDTNLVAQESGFTVQRSWSNVSASAGHDPCVPAPPGQVYVNVAPEQGKETLTLGVGESATIALYPFSDGAAAPWSLAAVAASGSPLGFDVEPATVSAGSHAALTVTLLSQPALGVDQLYGLVSQSGGETHVWPMIIQAK